MKKIFLPLTLLLGACSNSGTSSTAAEPADAAVDAASGVTSVPNETLFNGTLAIPPQHRATVTLTMGGSVRSTTLLPGAYVKQGDVLATLENPEFITLQQTYLDSHAQYECLRTEYLRQQTLSREEASSQKRYQQSRAEYLSMRSRMEAAAAQLALLGMDTTRLLSRGGDCAAAGGQGADQRLCGRREDEYRPPFRRGRAAVRDCRQARNDAPSDGL